MNLKIQPFQDMPDSYQALNQILNFQKVIPTSQSTFFYVLIFRECFAKENLDNNPYGLSSTGFNSRIHNFVDKSKHPVSHKYGSSSIIKNHPCQDVPF